jgi:uncharacterized protein YdhG (YjbR/CyaY superfamily)
MPDRARTKISGARAGRSAEIDTILAGLPADIRTALDTLRAMIATAAPEAIETISYGVTAFKYRGRPLVSFSAGRTQKGVCSFYVQSPAVMDAHRDDLAAYDTSKGTIHFAPDSPLPHELVTRLVRERMAETDAHGT